LRLLSLTAAGIMAVACQPQTVIVEKEVTREVLSEVTRIVKEVVTATPPPTKIPERANGLSFYPPESVSERYFTLGGRAEAGNTILVSHLNSLIAESDVDPRGKWEVDIPTSSFTRGNNKLEVNYKGCNYDPTVFDVDFTPWWLDVPLRSQGELVDGLACAFAALGMIMDYYNRISDWYPTYTTQKLIDYSKKLGFVPGMGINAQGILNLAVECGYSRSYTYDGWTQANLRVHIEGHNQRYPTPVLTIVRGGITTKGSPHAVLAIGISPDGERIMIADPVGKISEYRWGNFYDSWSSFDPNCKECYCHGVIVRP
jgi:hypothetical protein